MENGWWVYARAYDDRFLVGAQNSRLTLPDNCPAGKGCLRDSKTGREGASASGPGGRELGIGVRKAAPLLAKLDMENNRLVALETEVETDELRPNLDTGRGCFIQSNRLSLTRLHEFVKPDVSVAELRPLAIEDAMVRSLSLLHSDLQPFARIRPRAISFLPVALACQARCPFCFSKASISQDQTPESPNWTDVQAWLRHARARGAERAVITGGGEPTLLVGPSLRRLIQTCAEAFNKVVLITNGYALATKADPETTLSALCEAGLSVVAVSEKSTMYVYEHLYYLPH